MKSGTRRLTVLILFIFLIHACTGVRLGTSFLHESSNCIRYPPLFFFFFTCLLIPHPTREILFAVFEMQGIKLSQNINDKTAKFVAPFCTHCDASALQAFGKDAPEDRDTD